MLLIEYRSDEKRLLVDFRPFHLTKLRLNLRSSRSDYSVQHESLTCFPQDATPRRVADHPCTYGVSGVGIF
jgi:hypothetical protein